ncbi:MAG: glycosyl transferase family 1 [Acidobacteria bacterium]|nr:MAG: glycosyl transferase family 1 [Acidobacteriota bacterium]
MKILLSSHAFHPSIGGIETVAAMLASEFVARSEEVRVVTQTPKNETKHFSFEIVRRPSARKLLSLIAWSDVVLHVNISLRLGWPMLSGARPWVISHHTWIPGGLRGLLKRRCARMAHNISVSQAVARALGTASTVIPNAYDHDVFRVLADVPRDRDFVFLGRLVSDKGVECALMALRLIREKGLASNLTIIGTGPEEAKLRRFAQELGIAQQVLFAGVKRDDELARELNRHKVMLIPSLWQEPFGVVALEGIACGCVVVGSNKGGLPEAIGPCGMTFPNGDPAALANCLLKLASNNETPSQFRKHAPAHLARFRKPLVAERYLEVLKFASNPQRVPAASRLRQDQC